MLVGGTTGLRYPGASMDPEALETLLGGSLLSAAGLPECDSCQKSTRRFLFDNPGPATVRGVAFEEAGRAFYSSRIRPGRMMICLRCGYHWHLISESGSAANISPVQ